MVSLIGGDIERLISAMLHGDGAGGEDGATASCGSGNGIGIDGEGGVDGIVGGDVDKGVFGNGTHRSAVDGDVGDMVSLIGGDIERLISAMLHSYLARGGDGAIASCGSGNSIGFDGWGISNP